MPCWRFLVVQGASTFGAKDKSMAYTAAVITASDKGAAGLREDTSGPTLAQGLREMGLEVIDQRIVADDETLLSEAMIDLCDTLHVDTIVTTGGTGLTPRDRTPEATQRVIDRLVPGIAEALRSDGYRKTPRAVLSRGICGLRGRCLIINLPGSPKAVRDGLETLAPMLSHAIQMARGESLEHNVKSND